MALLLTACFWAIGFYICWMATRWSRIIRMSLRLPTLPGAWPIIGHAYMFKDARKTDKLHSILHEGSIQVDKLGGVAKLWNGPFPVLYVFTDPEDAVTVTNACIKKNYIYNFNSQFIGEGLLTAPPTKWKRHRKLLNPAFNQRVLDGFIGLFNTQAASLVDNMASKVGQGYFDHRPFVQDNALETICRTAFGLPTHEDNIVKKDYKMAFDILAEIVMKRTATLWMHLDFIYKWTNCKREEDKVVEILHRESMSVYKKAKAALASKQGLVNEDKKFKAFIDLLLELESDGSFTDEEVMEELDTMIVTGHDTSATEMIFMLVALGSYPEVQERIYQEILRVFGDSHRDVTKEDCPKLVYIEAVIKEVLRLYPVGPVILRDIDKDVKLKNFTVPGGTIAIISVWGINRSKVWGEDAHSFNPDRWLDPLTLPENTSAFSSFGLGRRACIGKSYAMMSMKTTLVHLMRRYRIKGDVNNLKLKIDVLLKPASGCQIGLEIR